MELCGLPPRGDEAFLANRYIAHHRPPNLLAHATRTNLTRLRHETVVYSSRVQKENTLPAISTNNYCGKHAFRNGKLYETRLTPNVCLSWRTFHPCPSTGRIHGLKESTPSLSPSENALHFGIASWIMTSTTSALVK